MYEFRIEVYDGMVDRRNGKEREVLGPDPWAYGLKANRHILETLIQYTFEQGLLTKKLEVDSLFAKSTLEEFKI
jgi:4,5-dihydroxyphthalate decarboxylase